MTTLKELHAKAGNPNLEHWKSRKIYSILEAAMLMAGHDPLEFGAYTIEEIFSHMHTAQPVNWQWVIMLSRSLAESVASQELKSPYVLLEFMVSEFGDREVGRREQHQLSIEDAPRIMVNQTLISREHHLKWLKKEGYLDDITPKQGNLKMVSGSVNAVQEILPTKLIGYTTPAMQCIQDVAREFWSDWKPGSTAPKRDVILKWVEQHADRYGLDSDRKRQAIDLITRHPEAREQTQRKKEG